MIAAGQENAAQKGSPMELKNRPRRNRKNEWIRDLVAETSLRAEHLIYPVFVHAGKGQETALKSLPGQSRWSPDMLTEKIGQWKNLGLRHFALFPAIEDRLKDPLGKESLNDNGLMAETLKRLKDAHPDVVLIADVALDPYSSDGHDGVVRHGQILNDESVELLAEMAVAQARWGADWVAPSDMMDGRVAAIRGALDDKGFVDTSILAYSAKYASAFYGPFREALASAPKSGDKKTYQMDPRNSKEALREVLLDIEEGADMVMVKPGLPYLDIVAKIKAHSSVPVAAYNVSGEYAMIKFAGLAGALNEEAAMMEMLLGFRRAGADAILTYFAVDAAKLLRARS